MKKNHIIILIGLFGLYFLMNLYINYKSQIMPDAPMATKEELESCSLETISENCVELTVPATYVNNATQEDLNTTAQKAGYESITLNEDGSATYRITPAQHQTMLENLRIGIQDKIKLLPTSPKYDSIDNIITNDDFTSYEVHLNISGTDFDTSMVILNLRMYTAMYQAFCGNNDISMHIDFYDKKGTLVASSDPIVVE